MRQHSFFLFSLHISPSISPADIAGARDPRQSHRNNQHAGQAQQARISRYELPLPGTLSRAMLHYLAISGIQHVRLSSTLSLSTVCRTRAILPGRRSVVLALISAVRTSQPLLLACIHDANGRFSCGHAPCPPSFFCPPSRLPSLPLFLARPPLSPHPPYLLLSVYGWLHNLGLFLSLANESSLAVSGAVSQCALLAALMTEGLPKRPVDHCCQFQLMPACRLAPAAP